MQQGSNEIIMMLDVWPAPLQVATNFVAVANEKNGHLNSQQKVADLWILFRGHVVSSNSFVLLMFMI